MVEYLEYWPVAVVLVGGLFTWAVWSLRRGFVTQEEFDEYKKETTARLDDGSQKFTTIQTTLDDLPTHRDIADINAGIAEINVKLAGVSSSNSALSNQMTLLLEHHLKVPVQ